MAQQLYQFDWPSGNFYFEQPWVIDDATLTLTVRWNTRSELYYVDIADSVLAPIVQGIPLKTGRNLIGPYATRGLPSGKMFVFDTTGQNSDAGLYSFGSTHVLCFVTAD